MDVGNELQNIHLVKKIQSQDQKVLLLVVAVKIFRVKMEHKNNFLVTKIVKIANKVEFKQMFIKLKK